MMMVKSFQYIISIRRSDRHRQAVIVLYIEYRYIAVKILQQLRLTMSRDLVYFAVLRIFCTCTSGVLMSVYFNNCCYLKVKFKLYCSVSMS